jgi:hypothetical protein
MAAGLLEVLEVDCCMAAGLLEVLVLNALVFYGRYCLVWQCTAAS